MTNGPTVLEPEILDGPLPAEPVSAGHRTGPHPFSPKGRVSVFKPGPLLGLVLVPFVLVFLVAAVVLIPLLLLTARWWFPRLSKRAAVFSSVMRRR